MTKEKLIDAINHRLHMTTGGRQQIAKRESDAPVVHALLAVLVEAIWGTESGK